MNKLNIKLKMKLFNTLVYYALFFILFQECIIIEGFAQNCSQFVTGDGQVNIGGYLVHLPTSDGGQQDFEIISGGNWSQTGSTATLTATLQNQTNANEQYELSVSFSGLVQAGDGNYPPIGSPLAGDGNCWYYYTSFTGSLTGVNGTDATGIVIDIFRGTKPAFQIGHSGSTQSSCYGGSGWFEFTVTGNSGNVPDYSGSHGDIYFCMNPCYSLQPDVNAPSTAGCNESVQVTVNVPNDAICVGNATEIRVRRASTSWSANWETGPSFTFTIPASELSGSAGDNISFFAEMRCAGNDCHPIPDNTFSIQLTDNGNCSGGGGGTGCATPPDGTITADDMQACEGDVVTLSLNNFDPNTEEWKLNGVGMGQYTSDLTYPNFTVPAPTSGNTINVSYTIRKINDTSCEVDKTLSFSCTCLPPAIVVDAPATICGTSDVLVNVDITDWGTCSNQSSLRLTTRTTDDAWYESDPHTVDANQMVTITIPQSTFPLSGQRCFVFSPNCFGTDFCSTIPPDYTIEFCILVIAESQCCSIDNLSETIACDDNGTPSNPNDDAFSVTIQPSGNALGSSYSITGDHNESNLSYNAPHTLNQLFPIANGPITIVIASDDSNNECMDSLTITPPNTCSNGPPCSLTQTGIVLSCSDNNTDSNPNDDTFIIEANPVGSNTSGTYSVSGDVTATNIPYGSLQQIGNSFPISGGALQITITDDGDNSCLIDTTINPPDPCSIPPCVLSITQIDVGNCSYNTNTNTSESIINVSIEWWNAPANDDILVTIGNQQEFVSVNTTNGISTIPFTVIANGSSNNGVQAVFQINGACGDFDFIDFPAPCPPCILSSIDAQVQCDNNGTGSDPSDDVFTITIQPTGDNIGSSYSVSGDIVATNLAYGSPQLIGNSFPVSSAGVTITVTDDGDSNCFLQETILPPNACSNDLPACPPVNCIPIHIEPKQ